LLRGGDERGRLRKDRRSLTDDVLNLGNGSNDLKFFGFVVAGLFDLRGYNVSLNLN
jgi:hypothetical protein